MGVSNTDKLFSLIIPTYMEAESLPFMINRIRHALKGCNYEIIVVDDNSPDYTWKIARELGLNVIVRSRKMGLGSAFIEGLKYVKGEFVGLIDADLQHPAELLTKMLQKVGEGADLVVASRYVGGAKIKNLPIARKLISKMAIVLAHLLLPGTAVVKDPLSGFFIVRKNRIAQLNTQGFKVLLDILAKGKNVNVVEIPCTFKSRKYGKSKLGAKEIWEYCKQIYRLLKEDGGTLRV